ncbi:DUF7199 family protein [[Mycobacterium] nativiensis]|uniref:Secreted protein n=1 Tax=[Mycobacterium] nativiensis TaxID=2855503 RepID=A0ABU5XVR4_9MYCO|nr:hypothetical protein [Mycolicibacter sp. MYC340]MEB3031091.1 hypothetical protein [Mycolicibacter sp. MYC340]
MRYLAASLAALAALGGLALAPAPEAMPCRHRGWTHVVQHANGNADADSRLHVLRGEQPTCPVYRGTETPGDSWQDRQRDINRERYGGW